MIYYDIHTHRPANHQEDVAIVNTGTGERKLSLLQYETTFPQSTGIHPWYIHIYNVQEQLAELESVITHPQIVAIGEAGLDKLAEAPISIQQEVFLAQALLAEKVNKPLIIHCVKAWTELIAARKSVKPHMPWIIHGFRGNAGLATQLLRQGFLLSFGLHFNPAAFSAAWPLCAFAETDDKEIDIRLVYKQLAISLNISPETLALQLEKNILSTFPLLR